MKKIEAIIRKTKFEEVKDSLLEADIEWFSYYELYGASGNPDKPVSTVVSCTTPVPSNVSSSLSLYAIKTQKRQYKLSSKPHKPAKSATAASSSSPLRMPYAYVLQREATSHSTMPNKKDNGQLQTTTKKIQYN